MLLNPSFERKIISEKLKICNTENDALRKTHHKLHIHFNENSMYKKALTYLKRIVIQTDRVRDNK